MEINELVTKVNWNIFSLNSYQMLIGIDWWELHIVKIDYYDKILECIDDKGQLQVIKGIPKPISIRKIMAL